MCESAQTIFAGVQHCRLLPEHRGEVSRSDGEGLRGPSENPSQALPRQLSPALLRGASQAGSSQTLLLTAYPPVTVAGSGDFRRGGHCGLPPPGSPYDGDGVRGLCFSAQKLYKAEKT